MGYAFVFLVAVGVGVAVYATTIRGERPIADGVFGSGDGPPEAAPGGTYVPVVAGRPDWQSRLTGFLGLVVAIVVSAIITATALYMGVSWLVHLIGSALGSGETASGA